MFFSFVTIVFHQKTPIIINFKYIFKDIFLVSDIRHGRIQEPHWPCAEGWFRSERGDKGATPSALDNQSKFSKRCTIHATNPLLAVPGQYCCPPYIG